MKNLYTLLITLFVVAFSNAQIVDIPDANFKNALVNDNVVDLDDDGIGDVDADSNDDGEIQVSEAEAVLNLDVSQKSISSLVGIQSFINLEVLNCNNNQLTNLEISQNSNLKELSCWFNQLANLDVSQNSNLENLYCFLNQLISLDITQNQNLIDLRCFNNQLTNLDVTLNPDLVVLACSDNQLTSLDVSQNQNLVALTCRDNQLTSLNIKNGNNLNLLSMEADDNSNLTCIEVDNVDYANNQNCDDDNWCKDDWTAYSEDCILGIEDSTLISFTIYPNPVSSVLFIGTQQPIEVVKIYNLQGQLIKEDSEGRVDVSQLSAGLYFIQLSIDGKTITKKFIKN